jgi:pimeloyl-ACP methyl ester carboxylesterase
MRNHPYLSARSARRRTLAAALVLLAGGLAACGTDDPAPAGTAATPTAAPTGQPAGIVCPEESGKGKPVWFNDGAGGVIAGISQGEGPVVVVLSHQNNSDGCEWLPFGAELVREKYRIVAIDLPGFGASATSPATPSQAVASVATALWQQGATSIALVGASMGGTASVVGSTETQAPVNGVVTLSSPISFAGMDASLSVGKMTAAALYITGKGDGDLAANAETMLKGMPPGVSRTKLLVEGGSHGTALIRDADDPVAKQIKDEIKKWLKDHVPA